MPDSDHDHPCWPLGNGDWMTNTCKACCGYQCCTNGINHSTAILVGVLAAIGIVAIVVFICCYRRRYGLIYRRPFRGKGGIGDSEILLVEDSFMAEDPVQQHEEYDQSMYQPSTFTGLSQPPLYSEHLPKTTV